MRIVTWNMRKSNATAWEYFLELEPDLALLQEVYNIPEAVRSSYECDIQKATHKTGVPQRFNTAVLVRGKIGPRIPLSRGVPWVDHLLNTSFKGTLIAKSVALANGEKLQAISVHSPYFSVCEDRENRIDALPLLEIDEKEIYLTDLLLATLKNQDLKGEQCWVVGGDMNSSETFDATWGSGNGEFLNGMKELGLTECLRHHNKRLIPTFQNARSKKVLHQLDHLFVSSALANRLAACIVGDANRVFGNSISDHLPIIADFNPM